MKLTKILFSVYVSSQNNNDWKPFLDHMRQFDDFKGPILKIFQFMSQQIFNIPLSVRDQLKHFCNQVTHVPEQQSQEFIDKILGPNWIDTFQSFDLKAIASASIGQVHKARLKTGELVACKMQYPDIEDYYRTDIKISTMFSEYFMRSANAKVIRLAELNREIIEKEVHYKNEVATQMQFKNIFKGLNDLDVPTIYPKLCNDKFLVMDFIDGIRVDEIKDKEIKKKVAKSLMRAYFYPLLKEKILYPDIQVGNFIVDKQGKLWMIDFGVIKKTTQGLVDGMVEFLSNTNFSNLDKVGGHTNDKALEKLFIDKYQIIWYPFYTDQKVIFSDNYYQQIYDRFHVIEERIKDNPNIIDVEEDLFLWLRASGLVSLLYDLNAGLNYYREFRDILKECEH